MSRFGKRADLVVHEEEPFNAETGLAALAKESPTKPYFGGPKESCGRPGPLGLAQEPVARAAGGNDVPKDRDHQIFGGVVVLTTSAPASSWSTAPMKALRYPTD